MRCEDVQLEALLTWKGLDQQAEAACRHLVDCPSCRQRMRVMVCLEALAREGVRISKRRGGFRWLAAAAVLLALALPALLIRDRPRPPGVGWTENAYPRFPLSIRSRREETDLRERAFEAYQAGDFETAAERLGQLPPDPEVSFFLGVSLYLADHAERALPALEQAQKSPRWRRPALWYRANTLLALGDAEKAGEILRGLAEGAGEFRAEAEALMDDLDLRPPPGRPR